MIRCTKGAHPQEGLQPPMTVGIAAVCEDGRKIVVAADRKLTAPAPVNLEFETEEQKMIRSRRAASSSSCRVTRGTALRFCSRPVAGLAATYPLPLLMSHSIWSQHTKLCVPKKTDETIIAPTLG
jgi:hypothetical protein